MTFEFMKLIDHPVISIQNDLLQTQNNTAVKSQRQKENRKGSRTEDRDLQRKPFGLPAAFSAEDNGPGGSRTMYSKCWKKKYQLRMLCLAKWSFRNEGEIRTRVENKSWGNSSLLDLPYKNCWKGTFRLKWKDANW